MNVSHASRSIRPLIIPDNKQFFCRKQRHDSSSHQHTYIRGIRACILHVRVGYINLVFDRIHTCGAI